MNFPVQLSSKHLLKAKKLRIRPEDIDEQFTKGGGHGGQKINKTSNRVVLIHRPTGFMVRCQEFRERGRNRVRAYEILINKIELSVLGKESERAKQNYKIKRQKQRRSRRSKEKMLEQKKRRGAIKRFRTVSPGVDY